MKYATRIAVAMALLLMAVLFFVAGCAGGPDVKNPAGPLKTSIQQVNAESKALAAVAGSLRALAPEVADGPATVLRAAADTLDRSSATLAAAAADIAVRSAEYADMPKTIEKLQKELAKERDAATTRGRWIFYAGIMLGILGVAGSVYAATQSFSMKTLGAAVGSFVLAGTSAGFLWYGNIIAIILLALVGLFGLGLMVYLALKWRTVLTKTAATFDMAEKEVGDGKILRDLKGAWKEAQETAKIDKVLKAVRGK